MIERESIWVDLVPLSTTCERCLTLRTGTIDHLSAGHSSIGTA